MNAVRNTRIGAAILLAAVAGACAGSCGASDRNTLAPTPPPSGGGPPTFPTPPSGSVIAKLDCSPGNFPGCGWAERGTGEGNVIVALQPGQGPRGQDVVQFTQTAGSQRQYYMGWGTPEGGDEPAGSIRFIRVRVFIPGPAGRLSGYQAAWDSKFLILGDGGRELSRVICILRDDGRSPDTMSIECQRNIDGGDHSTGLLSLTLGTWHDIQVEARSGSAASIAVWIDNNDYARPNARTTGNFSLETINWKFLGVGYYANTTRKQDEDQVALRVADDVELGSGFDPAWHR
jgi:hypothetical protein